MVSPTTSFVPITRLKMPLSPWREKTRLQIFCTAMAVSGVCDDGFHSTQSPHTAAIMAFQDHTATGKIEGADHARDPQRMPLLVHAMAGPLAVHGQAVELAGEPTAKSATSIISCTSPSPSARILPISMLTSAPSSALCARSSLAISRTISPRCGSGQHAPRFEGLGGARAPRDHNPRRRPW